MNSARLIFFVLVLWSDQLAFIAPQGLEVLPIHLQKSLYSAGDQITTLLNKPYSPATYASMASYIYQLYGQSFVIDIQSKQSCRLNSNPCRSDDQCCSKFCRCTRWNTMGKEVCWRKCL